MTIDIRLWNLVMNPATTLILDCQETESKIYFNKDINNEWILNWKLDFIHYNLKRKWLIFWDKEEIRDTIKFSVKWDDLKGSKELKDKIWYEYGLRSQQ